MTGPLNEAAADTAVMATTAQDFETQADGIMAYLKTLTGQVEGMQAQWIGKGGTAYQSAMRAWREHQDQINVQLVATAEMIRTSGKSYGITEDEASSNIAAQAGTLPTLPL